MKIVTNNQPRLLLDWNELTLKEQSDFYRHDTEFDTGDFVRYKGIVYDVCQFSILDTGSDLNMAGWQGIEGQSAFHSVVVKYMEDDNDYVIIGSVYS